MLSSTGTLAPVKLFPRYIVIIIMAMDVVVLGANP